MLLEQLIYTCEKNNILITSCKYEENKYPVKLRYEFYGKNKQNTCNKYMYLRSWDKFHKLYKIIDPKDKHFYEMINDKCKFFLDIDGKEIKTNDWKIYLRSVEKILINFFKKELNIDINPIKCESSEDKYETKKSCHIIVPKYCFLVEDCKYLCNKFVNNYIKDEKLKNIIDLTVYGKNRCLRIPYSTKINSNRIKNVPIVYYKDSFITDIENTEFLTIGRKNIIKNVKKSRNVFNNKINKSNIICKEENIYKNYVEMLNKLINVNKKTFKPRKDGINNNMIICDRINSSYCQQCKRIHDHENPFIIVKESQNKLYLYCRRNPKPTVYDIVKSDENKNITIFNDIKLIVFLEKIKRILVIKNGNIFFIDIEILFIQLIQLFIKYINMNIHFKNKETINLPVKYIYCNFKG